MFKKLRPLLSIRKTDMKYENLSKIEEDKLEKPFRDFIEKLKKTNQKTQNYIDFLAKFSLKEENEKLDKKTFDFYFLGTPQGEYYRFNEKLAYYYMSLIEIAKKINRKNSHIKNLSKENKEDLVKEITSFFEACKNKEKIEVKKIHEGVISSKGVCFSNFEEFSELNMLAINLRTNFYTELSLDKIPTSSKQGVNFSLLEKKNKRDKKIIKI